MERTYTPPEDLPMIYIRPQINGTIAMYTGNRTDPDPRPGEDVLYFPDIKECEEAITAFQSEVGDYWGVCYVYIDQYLAKQRKKS